MSYLIPQNANVSHVYQNICMLLNPFGESESKLLDNAEDRNQKIINLKEDLAEKGHDTLTLMNFLDIDAMLELADGTREAYEAIQFSVNLYAEAKAYQMLGIKTTYSDNRLALKAGYRLYGIGEELVRRLYVEFKKLIDPNDGLFADEGFENIVYKAIRNLSKEQVNWIKYQRMHGMEPTKLPDGSLDMTVPAEYEEEYADWEDDLFAEALEVLYKKPSSPYHIAPLYFKEFKDALRKYVPTDKEAYVDDLTMNVVTAFNGPEVIGAEIATWGLTKEEMQELANAFSLCCKANIITILNPSTTDAERNDGNHDKAFYGSITLPELIYNILLVTSDEVRNNYTEEDEKEGTLPSLSTGAKYVVDLVTQIMQEFILDTDGEVEITDSFAYSYMSLFRLMCPEYISTSSLVRFNTHFWMQATTAVHLVMRIEDGKPIDKDNLADTTDEIVRGEDE
jgi:hypothetical protein